jgi:uncharacterized protein (DUF2235 family)
MPRNGERSKKRLVVCCDGTWNWPDQKGSPTNVVKMARAVLPSAPDGVPQLVFYDTGVGTGNVADRMLGGMFGVGLGENVKQAYGLLADNWEPGDELFFFGFSRGAHTVRSLAGIVGLVGLLEKQHMDRFPDAWAYYRTPPAERTPQQRARFAEISRRTRIEVVGVWDTVGTMGVPFGPLRVLGRRRYHFHNTNLGDNVAAAYQALAIDERRRAFEPTVWRRELGLDERLASYGIERQVLEQVWFAGVHSNVGGGYPDCGLSDRAFVWMAERAMRHGLALDEGYVRRMHETACDLLVNSRTLKWRFSPARIRTPCAIDASERIHHSAYERLQGQPKGFRPEPYEAPNLRQFIQSKGDRVKNWIEW